MLWGRGGGLQSAILHIKNKRRDKANSRKMEREDVKAHVPEQTEWRLQLELREGGEVEPSPAEQLQAPSSLADPMAAPLGQSSLHVAQALCPIAKALHATSSSS